MSNIVNETAISKLLNGFEKVDKITHKLDQGMRAKMINLLASWYSNENIISYFREKHEIEITSQAVTYYRTEWKDEVLAEREIQRQNVNKIPIANKFYRLMVLQKMIEDLSMNLWNEKPIPKSTGGFHEDENGNLIMVKTQPNHTRVQTIIEAARKEMEDWDKVDDDDFKKHMELLSLKGPELKTALDGIKAAEKIKLDKKIKNQRL